VLINLVKNALKFTPRGQITIKARYNNAKSIIILQIQDTGIGIAAEDFPLIFTRFGKLQRSADMNSEGIGLGLMIVKQIVEQSGGLIEARSEGLGRGSSFVFSMQMNTQLVKPSTFEGEDNDE